MNIQYILLVSRQGKIRLIKWYQSSLSCTPPLLLSNGTTSLSKDKQKILKDIAHMVIQRRAKMCNVIEYKGSKIVYKRYASLYFIFSIPMEENELIVLELIQRYVEILDKHFGNVCELDLIFNYQKAYYILDDLLSTGEIQETSKKQILRHIEQQDTIEAEEQEAIKKSSSFLL